MEKDKKIEEMNLNQKIAGVRSIAEVVCKDASGYGYKYASSPEILAKVTAGMKKYHLNLIPHMVPGSQEVVQYSYTKKKFLKNGESYDDPINEVLFNSQIVYTWIDIDTGESLDVPWFITGSQADPSQALGGALTYGMRYFLLNFFQIASVEDTDPDAWRSKQKAAQEEENRMIVAQIAEKIDSAVRTYLADHEDKKSEVKAFLTKYVKNGDYFKIGEPPLAAKLLDDFTKNYIETKE